MVKRRDVSRKFSKYFMRCNTIYFNHIQATYEPKGRGERRHSIRVSIRFNFDCKPSEFIHLDQRRFKIVKPPFSPSTNAEFENHFRANRLEANTINPPNRQIPAKPAIRTALAKRRLTSCIASLCSFVT